MDSEGIHIQVVSSQCEQKKAALSVGAFERVQPLFACYNIFGVEMQPAEDPTPEFIHIFGDCFLASTTTNSSLQEAKNSVTSCLTVSRAHTYDSVETAVMVLYSVLLKIGKECRCTDVRVSRVLITDGLTVRCLLLTVN